MANYDTEAIRRLANRLDNTAQSLSQIQRNSSNKVSGISQEMTGDTINAIDSVNEKLSEELRAICKGLTRNANALYQYARELDIADAKAKSMIGSN